MNLCMYAAACPQYDDETDKWDESIDMCDDSNIDIQATEQYVY